MAELKFFDTFKKFEHYFEFTEYIRDHIYYYSTIVKSLQNLKTVLLKFSLSDGFKRKKYTSKIKFNLLKKNFNFRNFAKSF